MVTHNSKSDLPLVFKKTSPDKIEEKATHDLTDIDGKLETLIEKITL